MRGRSRPSMLVLAVALAIGLTACTSSPTPSGGGSPSGTEPAYKVTVAGDSISVGFGAELRTVVPPSMVVKVIGEGGTGLARPDKFDWPTRLQQLARDFPPRVLVLSLASNDAQDLRDANGATVARFADQKAWDAEYSRRLAASFDTFAPAAAAPATGATTKPTVPTTVVWLGHVRTADEKVGSTNRHVHELAKAVAATRPWVQVEDLAELLGTGEGKADRCLIEDGLHLTVECYDEAAKNLVPRLPA